MKRMQFLYGGVLAALSALLAGVPRIEAEEEEGFTTDRENTARP